MARVGDGVAAHGLVCAVIGRLWAGAQVRDARDELNDLRRDFRRACGEYDRVLADLKARNGVIPQPPGRAGGGGPGGRPESIVFDDPAVRRRFREIWQRKEDLLVELEVAALRENDARHYHDGLRRNCTLRALGCADCGLFGPAGRAAALTLAWSTALTALDLSRNSLGAGGATAIAEALAGHSSLTALELGGNVFGADAGTAFAAALRRNSRLVRCGLADNSMADAAADAFADVLRANRSLRSLDLRRAAAHAAPAAHAAHAAHAAPAARFFRGASLSTSMPGVRPVTRGFGAVMRGVGAASCYARCQSPCKCSEVSELVSVRGVGAFSPRIIGGGLGRGGPGRGGAGPVGRRQWQSDHGGAGQAAGAGGSGAGQGGDAGADAAADAAKHHRAGGAAQHHAHTGQGLEVPAGGAAAACARAGSMPESG